MKKTGIFRVGAIICAMTLLVGWQTLAQNVVVADKIEVGWKDHRPRTLLLRNNADVPQTAVVAIKTYRSVPNNPACINKSAPIYLIVGSEALIHTTLVRRVTIPAHKEKQITAECFDIYLIGEEPPRGKGGKR